MRNRPVPPRVVIQLAPIVTSDCQEVRLAVTECPGGRRLELQTWALGRERYHAIGPPVVIPIGLIHELKARLLAAER